MSNPQHPPRSPNKKRRFNAAFKSQAVELARQIGFRQAAVDLDVNEGNLRNWSKALAGRGPQAFAPLAERTDSDAELKRLREENRILKMERDILKKATAFFARQPE